MAQKQIRNLSDLREERRRLTHEYKEIEHQLKRSATSPKMALSAANTLLSINRNRRAKKKNQKTKAQAPRLSPLGLLRKKHKEDAPQRLAPQSLLESPKDELKRNKNNFNKSYRKVFKSLLIWQGVSLALFIGIDTYLYFKKKKPK